MISFLRRIAPSSLRAGVSARVALALFLVIFVAAAHAVVVRGRVITPLGVAVPGAKVQLVESGKVVAVVYAGADGTFEIRTGEAGRFTLLTSANGYLPAIGDNFYGGAEAVMAQDAVMSQTTVRQEVTVVATGIPTPVQELSVPLTIIPNESLTTRVGITEEMRQEPGAFLVQTGQVGGVTSLFMRGGQSDANKVLVDGVPAEDVGGRFDFGTVSSTGIGTLEIYRGPNSALYGSDALASVVSITTPRGESLRPVVNYSGDAGNLHTFRNEAEVSGAHAKLDYLGGYSWFQTSNALQNDEYHSGTVVANLGYALAARTLLRGTVREAVSASGVPNAHDFFGISANAKEQDQDTYAQGTLENRTQGDWHNLVRYGIARKREEFTTFGTVGTLGAYGTYYGNTMTITGANGYSVTGASAIAFAGTYPASYLLVSDRDELYYQSDYAFTRHLTALFGFRYENERGAYHYPIYGTNQNLQRTNFEYSGLFQGDIKNRVFYSLGGAVEKNHLYGTRGTPRLGLSWVAVRPSDRKFHGTKLRFDVSRGVQEPNLTAQFGSLYGFLTTPPVAPANPGLIAAYGVTPPKAEEARTYDYGIDQNILSNKLVLKAGYFHTQYDHQIEYVSSSALKMYFGITTTPAGLYGAYTNSLTYRAQGAESELQYSPTHHIFLRGGYTYLAATVERSFSSDALRVYGSTTNPLFPGITIGSSSPLVGNHPFRRAPNTGFLSAQYTGTAFTMGVRAAFAGKSDDSTFLSTALLLPNQNLDYGYTKLDVDATYRVTRHVTAFSQVENLLNNQHIGPIGYPGLPLTVRGGLKIRVGGD